MQISSLKVELAEKRPELNFGAQVKMFPHSILILIIIYIYNRLPIIIVGFMRVFFFGIGGSRGVRFKQGRINSVSMKRKYLLESKIWWNHARLKLFLKLNEERCEI